MLQVQTHNLTGVIQLCHTSCVRASSPAFTVPHCLFSPSTMEDRSLHTSQQVGRDQ